jgi:putrescine aminotransferase
MSTTAPAASAMDGALHDVIRRETGVIVRDGATTLALSPPLVVSHEQPDEVVAAISGVLERTGTDGHVAPMRRSGQDDERVLTG